MAKPLNRMKDQERQSEEKKENGRQDVGQHFLHAQK